MDSVQLAHKSPSFSHLVLDSQHLIHDTVVLRFFAWCLDDGRRPDLRLLPAAFSVRSLLDLGVAIALLPAELILVSNMEFRSSSA